MQKAVYNFGIIGAGNVAKLHAEAIGAIERCKLIGVTAIPFDAAESFAQEYNAKAYQNIDEIASDPDIDVVTLCTPSGLHAKQAITLLESGKHVIVEKPLAISIEDADKVINTADQMGVKLGVVSQRRYDPAIAAIKSAVDNGLFGRLILLNGHVHYYRKPEYYSSSDWRGTWSMDGGGALMNQGIHAVDLIRWIGGPVKSICANARTLHHDIEVEDTLVASLEFENGTLGTLQSTTCAYPGLHVRLEVLGDAGTAVIEDSDIVYWKTKDEAPCPALSKNSSIGSGSYNPMAFSAAGHIAQFKDFINAIDEDRKPAIDGVEGRRAVEIVLGAYASSRTGKPLSLPLKIDTACRSSNL
ncbi:Gfo/Idh/MocA family oxidoreductase [bacterium]|nr:Gfo/Idh/MocA family oxidoreductase [bacterium]